MVPVEVGGNVVPDGVSIGVVRRLVEDGHLGEEGRGGWERGDGGWGRRIAMERRGGEEVLLMVLVTSPHLGSISAPHRAAAVSKQSLHLRQPTCNTANSNQCRNPQKRSNRPNISSALGL